MKSIITLILATVLVFATMTVLMIPTSGAAVEGDWVTSRAADDYADPESYRPACGYKYDLDKGLVLVSADYTNNTPYTHVHTKTPYNLQEVNADGKGNSVSVEMTVENFGYGGSDHWVSFSLHSQEIFAPGQTGYGEGVSVLIRGAGDGSAIAQFFFLSDDAGYELFSMQQVIIPMNDQGQETYTFEVKYTGSAYRFYLCGKEFFDETGRADEVLNTYCKDGAYVGMSFYSNESASTIEAYVSKFQGEMPYGEDSAEPEENRNNFAEIADSATVEQGKPALIWNAAKEQFKDFKGSNFDFAINEDGTVRTTAKTASGYLIFSPKVTVSYEAADFPVIAVLTRNCYAESGTVYYSAGDVLSADPDCSCEIDIAEYDYGEGWCMGILDLTDDLDWRGRVNMLRCDFNNIDYEDEDTKNFDIAYVATFRTIEDAEKYAEAYLIDLLGSMPETEDNTTKAPDTTAPDAETTDNQTEAAPSDQTTDAEKTTGGCGSVIAVPVLVLIATMSVAAITKKKD